MQQGLLLMSGCGCEIESKNNGERRTLIILLGINGVIFSAEISVGIISDSTALIAYSLNMLADASIYAIGLYTVGRSLLAKAKAAHISKSGQRPLCTEPNRVSGRVFGFAVLFKPSHNNYIHTPTD